MKKNILDFCFKTPINSYNFTSFIGGAMFAKDQRYYPYYLSNHVVLASDDFFDVICNDLIMFDDVILERKDLKASDYTLEMLKKELIEMIDEGYYISATVDEYYIPHRYCFGKESFYHDILIYGYDEKDNVFYTAGYDITNKFNAYEYNMDLICETIIHCLNEKKTKPHFHYFKCKEMDMPFLYEDVKLKLEKYLLSEPAVRRENEEGKEHATFGIEAYNGIIGRFNYSCENNKFWRRASFSMLYEHKKIMTNRVKYINEHFVEIPDEVLSEFDEILSKAYTIQMKAIKYLVIRDPAEKDKIICDLEWMQQWEARAIKNLLKRM